MTAAIRTASSGFRVWLMIDGRRYPLTSVEVNYSINRPGTASADLAVGTRVELGNQARAAMPTIERGTPAKIMIDIERGMSDPVNDTELLTEGEHVLFDGLVDDIGPSNLSQGSFNARICLISRLALLSNGTLQLGKLAPRTFLDPTSLLSGTGSDSETPRFSNFGTGYWDELRRVMIAIALPDMSTVNGNSSLKQYHDAINAAGGAEGPNEQAAAILRSITGSLTFDSFWLERDFANHLARYHTSLFGSNFKMESFLNRIVNLGQEFKFRLLETPTRTEVIPFSPFFQADQAYNLHPSNIIAATWTNQQPDSCSGVVMMAGGPSATGNQARPNWVLGSHVRPGNNPFGLIVPVMAPPWFYSQSKTDKQSNGNALPPGLANTLGAAYAKELALELGYVGRCMTLQCPLRTDVATYSAVKVNYPDNPHLGLGTAVYGSVQSVRLYADSEKESAGTILEVGYVRSTAQQEAEFADYKHPIWDSQHGHARLI